MTRNVLIKYLTNFGKNRLVPRSTTLKNCFSICEYSVITINIIQSSEQINSHYLKNYIVNPCLLKTKPPGQLEHFLCVI